MHWCLKASKPAYLRQIVLIWKQSIAHHLVAIRERESHSGATHWKPLRVLHVPCLHVELAWNIQVLHVPRSRSPGRKEALLHACRIVRTHGVGHSQAELPCVEHLLACILLLHLLEEERICCVPGEQSAALHI